MPERLTRLGDEVYARFDGHHARRTTPPFRREIALIGKLVDYIERTLWVPNPNPTARVRRAGRTIPIGLCQIRTAPVVSARDDH